MNYQAYIDNLYRYAELNKADFSGDTDEETLVAHLVEISNAKREIQLDNNRILKEIFSPYEENPDSITEEILEEFRGFWSALREYSTGMFLDRTISYRINKILFTYHYRTQNWAGVARQLYLFAYFESLECDRVHWKFPRKEWIDTETLISKLPFMGENGPFLLANYLGALVFDGSGYHDALYRFEAFSRFIEEQKLDTESEEFINEGCYYFAIIDTLSQCSSAYYDGEEYTAEEKWRLEALWEKLSAMVAGGKYRHQNATAALVCHEAAFLFGGMPLHLFLSKLKWELRSGNTNEITAENSYLFLYTAKYVAYLLRYGKGSEEQKLAHCNLVLGNVLDRFKAKEKSLDILYTMNGCSQFIEQLAPLLGFDYFSEYVLKLTVCSDKALYLHTVMVKKIGLVLLKEILRTDPEFLSGVAGFDKDYIVTHPEEILSLWDRSAMFHDIGKHFIIDYVSNSSRNLTDDEFRLIKYHPENFSVFFKESTGPAFDCIRDCALYHHVWYNGKGGYPVLPPAAGNKPFIDILSIADSIDAATDIIGRPYTAGKTLEMLIEEFDTFRDTRYSAFVIDVLKRDAVRREVNELIRSERRRINFEVYTTNGLLSEK